MKKSILFVFILLFTCVIFSTPTITINSIGMHGPNGLGDFNVSDGDNITLRVNYTVSSLIESSPINGFSFIDAFTDLQKKGHILLTFYSSDTPNEDDWADEIFYPVLISQNTENGTFDITSTINIGQIMEEAISFQANLCLFTTDNDFSGSYSSYQEDSFYSTTVPSGALDTGFQNYLTVYTDTETLLPTLYTPNSPTIATYDNSSLLIDFQLAELPLANSVKLYFSPNADGSDPTTTLTLAPSLQNTAQHQITLDASSFSTASPHLSGVSGETLLTHLNTYYVAIGYQDALENPEAKSSWHKLIYDNVAIPPKNVYANTGSENSNFEVQFTLDESSKNDGIIIYIKNYANNLEITSITLSGIYAAGAHTITLNGSNLLSSTGVLSVTENYELVSGTFYKVAVGIKDLAGNTNTSTNSPFQYFIADTNISTIVAEYNPTETLAGYSSGIYQPIGYIGLKTTSGVATLSKLGIDIGGTIDSDDASNLALYESSNSDFSGAVLIGDYLTFTGTGLYDFNINDKVIGNDYKYYFVAVSLNSDNLSYDAKISLSTNSGHITTTGTVDTFDSVIFAEKHLYQVPIVDYMSNFPSITLGTPNTPFFRLDLKTNDGTASVTSIQLAVTGDNLTSNDVEPGGFKLWESTSPTFNAKTVVPIELGNVDYNNLLTFSGFSSDFTAIGKYYFFTVSTKSTANPEATIGGDILSAHAIVTTCSAGAIPLAGTFPLIGELQTLPVELSSFTASLSSNNDVSINWTVEAEIGLSGYYILRANSDDLNTAMTISVLIPSVNSPQTYTYSFVDDELDPAISEYYYWLTTVELSNESETFGPILVRIENNQDNDLPALVLGTALIGNYPNPFNPSTSISFSLEKPEHVVINIYNIRGQLVRKLYNENVTKVNQRINIVWNGKDSKGSSAASGIYYARMIAGKHSESKKMILMK